LDSAFEFFVARAFEKLLEKKYNAPDAKRKLIGDLANNKIDYDLYCSILLPEIYRKSEILKKIKEKRNLGSHSRVFTKNGDYNPDCYLNEEQINQFTDTSKEIMKEIMKEIAEAIDSN
jgi:hypothetical protein